MGRLSWILWLLCSCGGPTVPGDVFDRLDKRAADAGVDAAPPAVP